MISEVKEGKLVIQVKLNEHDAISDEQELEETLYLLFGQVWVGCTDGRLREICERMVVETSLCNHVNKVAQRAAEHYDENAIDKDVERAIGSRL